MKKKKQFENELPSIDNINEANLFIRELWQKLREYEDRLTMNSRNSSKSPSLDSPADKVERNKVGAQPRHTGHKRPLAALGETDEQIVCLPDACCPDCGERLLSMNEDACRIRQKNSTENLATVRHVALNLLKTDGSFKGGIKRKHKQANRSDSYRGRC